MSCSCGHLALVHERTGPSRSGHGACREDSCGCPRYDAPPLVTLHFDGDFDLPIGDVFPDGVPDPLTVGHVVEAVQSAQTVGRLISEWGVAPGVSVTLNQPVADGRQRDYRQVNL